MQYTFIVLETVQPKTIKSEIAGHSIDRDIYQETLIADIYSIVGSDSEESHAQLKAILDKYPALVNARRVHGEIPPGEETLTPLHLAAKSGSADNILLLLEKGADVNSAAAHGVTPLHLAVKEENLAIVKLLVEHGANINAKTDAIAEMYSDGFVVSGAPGFGPGEYRDQPIIFPAVPARTPLDLAKAMRERSGRNEDVLAYLQSVKK